MSRKGTKKVTFEYDVHLIDLGRRQYSLLKGTEPPGMVEFHRMVYDVGLRVLQAELKRRLKADGLD